MLGPRVVMGMAVAILGVAIFGVSANPAVSDSASGAKHQPQCAGKTAKSKAKDLKRRAKCKKARKGTHKKTLVVRHSVSPAAPQPVPPTVMTPTDSTPTPSTPVVTTPTGSTPPPTAPTPTVPTTPVPPPEVPSATLLVKVYTVGGPAPGAEQPDEGQLIRVSRIGPGGETLSTIETHEHTILVVPGTYQIAALDGFGLIPSETVVVGAYEERVVSLTLEIL